MLIDKNEYATVIANNLRRLALDKDVTQRQIADVIGVSPATVSGWMNGKKTPRMNKIELLCDFFGCKRSDIIEPDGMRPKMKITEEQADLIRLAMQARPENVTMVLNILKRLEGVS